MHIEIEMVTNEVWILHSGEYAMQVGPKCFRGGLRNCFSLQKITPIVTTFRLQKILWRIEFLNVLAYLLI